ncbi:hypothetical protein [Spirosoma areae]
MKSPRTSKKKSSTPVNSPKGLHLGRPYHEQRHFSEAELLEMQTNPVMFEIDPIAMQKYKDSRASCTKQVLAK